VLAGGKSEPNCHHLCRPLRRTMETLLEYRLLKLDTPFPHYVMGILSCNRPKSMLHCAHNLKDRPVCAEGIVLFLTSMPLPCLERTFAAGLGEQFRPQGDVNFENRKIKFQKQSVNTDDYGFNTDCFGDFYQ